jgi:hypothetical protein
MSPPPSSKLNIIIRRTAVSGRVPNTTNSANTQYISTGELALNLTDNKLFSSNGSAAFEVGSNLTSLTVSNTIFLGNSTVNATVNSSSIYIANSTANTLIKPGNVAIFGSILQIGNSTVNSVMTSTAIAVNGDYVTTNNYVQNTFISNTAAYEAFALSSQVTSSVDATISNTLNVANTLYVNTTAIRIANNISLYANGGFGGSGTYLASNGTGLFWASAIAPSSLTVDSVTVSNGQLTVGNSTINTVVTNTGISINGSYGSAGQKLTSNGTASSWATVFTASNTAPSTPNYGDIWYLVSDSKPYMWVYDGTNSYWFDFLPPA